MKALTQQQNVADVRVRGFERAAVRHPVDGRWIIVTRGEPGYRELGPRDHSAPFDGHAFNAEHGISTERAEAMLAGSMFGWDCPAAQKGA